MLLLLVIACFTLSGFAALIYQTAWMRQFAIAFGTSEIAVTVVLAAYMAGLALGAAIAARYIDRVRRPVLVYGVLEGAIAIVALALPWLVDASGGLYVYLVGNQPTPPDASTIGQTLYYSITSFVVLLIPTALMGATLPLLARYAVTTNRNLGGRVSMLYSMNTLGAVGGTLAAGYLLLPALGLRATVWIGVLTNGIIFVIAAVIARFVANAPTDQAAKADIKQQARAAGVSFILPLIALSGAVSFVYEVLWTRMLSHVLGSSVYAFSTMLSAFLSGIAIGAAAAGFVAKNPRRAVMLFAACQFGVAVTSAFVYWQLEHSIPSGLGHALIAFAAILPSSIFIGATYPLAVRAHAGDVAIVGRASAIVYSWNTIGAISGALLGGFIIIPQLGFAGTARVAVVANLCIGLAALILFARVPRWEPLGRVRAATAVIVLIGLVTVFQPGRPDAVVTRTHFGGSTEPFVRDVFYSVGRSSTVWMTENRARFDLSTNGLPEAQIEFKGAPPMVLSQRWLGIWPSLARPDADSVLVVGLGGGVVLEGIPDSIETLHVVELEADVVAANRLIGDRRGIDPLADDRLHLVVNDARNALRLTSHKYDAVVSQPSHPWTAGASHLFTREFFALVKSRLHDDGVFVQWMNAEFLNEKLLRELAATLLTEFENVRIYQPSALALHFLATDGPIDIERQLVETGRPLLDEFGHYSRNGINSVSDLFSALLVDEHGMGLLAADNKPITDDDNRMAIDSNVRAAGLDNESLMALTASVDPLLSPDSWLRQAMSDSDLVFVAARLLYDGQSDRARLLGDSAAGTSGGDVVQAMLNRYEGKEADAQELLAGIGPTDAVFEQAEYLQVADQLASMFYRDFKAQAYPGLDRPDSRLGAVLSGWRALGAEDWQGLAELEPRLRQTRTNDLWKLHAAQLRAEWRLRADDQSGRLAREALLIIDQSLATQATQESYAQRARAGQKLGDYSVFIESVAFLLRSIDDRLWGLDYNGYALEAGEHRWITGQLESFEDELRRIIALDDSGRSEIVLSELIELRESLANY